MQTLCYNLREEQGTAECVTLGIIWHIVAHFKATDHKAFRPSSSRLANCTLTRFRSSATEESAMLNEITDPSEQAYRNFQRHVDRLCLLIVASDCSDGEID